MYQEKAFSACLISVESLFFIICTLPCMQSNCEDTTYGFVCSFECKSDGTYLDINHISLEKTDEDPEESAYTGPVSPLYAFHV